MGMARAARSRTSRLRRMLGRRQDWRLKVPNIRILRPHFGWIGPMLVLATTIASIIAASGGSGPAGDATAAGLTIGAASMALMAWSFILAVRIPLIEPIFGGLDSAYRVHRWAGALSIPMMLFHAGSAEIADGYLEFSRSASNTGLTVAGVALIMGIALFLLSILRWMPYRWWRLTHKLFGVVYIFAAWHIYTVEKPYQNWSVQGAYLNVLMAAGLLAFLYRVIGRDMIRRGLRYRVVSATRVGTAVDLVLEPMGKDLDYHPGQFAVIKVQKRGLSEPHVFTVAAPPGSGHLRFFIRRLGDWTAKLYDADLEGVEVLVEGPYGTFEATKQDAPTVWVAGGVGITPFLSNSTVLPTDSHNPPVLFYCVRTRDDAMGIELLDRAHRDGKIDLQIIASADGQRFTKSTLADHFGPKGLKGGHVALCGPKSLIISAEKASRKLGAASVETEDFDFRQGFGPDLPGLRRD
ncbi:ferric reductase-like transmembrane domain-containing protein [Candidatus Poriferisocius sp.]|uniref:ferredoxin reductase family protein n=1 Tax=Candidatus Poriferisocius sp. TaxID=3101276 RepID=UPI003B0176A0